MASLFKDYLKSIPGLQFVYDNLSLLSAPGRKAMLYQPFSSDIGVLQHLWSDIDAMLRCLSDDSLQQHVVEYEHALMQLHDISATVQSLSSHIQLNEVELFELKKFAMLVAKLQSAVSNLGLSTIISLPELSTVFSILDPDNTGVPSFYIYDSYDSRLPHLRAQIRQLQQSTDNPELASLFAMQETVQQQVIALLQQKLFPYADALDEALSKAAYADVLLAKAKLALSWHLVAPCVVADGIAYQQLVNPRLQHRNAELGLRYQAVDISVSQGVCVVTGANMSGKTVLLKSMAVAQIMAQCGLYAPASGASIVLVDDVVMCIGDEQNELNGLSSYASEIMKISDVVSRSEHEQLLILVDEPARTTNPVEGRAIVCAIVDVLRHRNSITVLTTHYGGVGVNCRCLRVRGFVEGLDNIPLSPSNINRFMDYTLLPDDCGETPHEALRIASLLGCDSMLITAAQRFLSDEK